MRNLYLYLLLPFLFLVLILLLSVKYDIGKSGTERGRMALNANKEYELINNHVNYIGEKIVYDVKFGKLYLGKAQFNNLENTNLNGRNLGVMTLETRLARFIDTEKIYSDLDTLLPVRIERDILKWLVRENIVEDYDQNNFIVTIVKNTGSKQEKIVIKKDGPINNAVLLPYYVRRLVRLEQGEVIVANLPTCRLEMKLVSIEDVKVPAGNFKAYHFKSIPKQIEIWISIDERRIPLKIQGNGLFGYSMVMDEYSFDPKRTGAKGVSYE